MNEDIFRTYDIRGVVDRDFNPELIFSIGKAFGTFLKNNNQNIMSISGDVRHTTQKLKDDFINGVLCVGVNVCDMGDLPTPVNYFSLFHTNIPNSVQITGSHNPSEYNGFKLSYNKKPFYGDDIQDLKVIIKNSNYFISDIKGSLEKNTILAEYSSFIYSNININKKIKVAMDCGNAAACLIAPNIFKKMGIELVELYCDIDPDFPNHHPDPTVDSNLDDLRKIVVDENCNLGIAYDGDADRVVIVDECGKIIRSDILIALFVEKIISKGDSVVYDVKCSKALEETINKYEGNPIMWKTGHSHIKNKMLETKSKIGGEMSGHIFFADKYFGFDDGIYVSLRLIELLSNTNENISKMVSKIPIYTSTPEIRIDCIDDNEKRYICEKAVDFFTKSYKCITIDGARIKFPNGWALVRSSNTQPVIVCRFEADSEDNLKIIKDIVFNKLKEYAKIDV